MSYAEPSPWSDVYVWRNGKVLHCEALGKTYTATEAQSMYDHLRMHQRKGDRVPDAALERLWHEARGLPYRTDVERSLKALKSLRG